jgi:hypothetical protein
LSTPRLLVAGLTAICAAGVLYCLAVIVGSRVYWNSIKTVGRDSVPSILAAAKIKASFADTDANLANELMVPPGKFASSIGSYDQRIAEATDGLVHAAENITYGDAERVPIKTMVAGLGNYESWAAQARLMHNHGDNAWSVKLYRQTESVLDKTLLTAADQLAKANSDELDTTYSSARARFAVAIVLLIGATLLLVGALGWLQMFLSHRMHRLINPGLLAATVIVVGFSLFTVHAFNGAAAQLKTAKEDAFDSLDALWNARAVAFDANADESRYLFDHELGANYENAFFTKNAKLLSLSGVQTDESSYDAVSRAAASGSTAAGETGYLAKELSNVTFEGEADAARTALATFGAYYADDKRIRDLERAGRHDEAVAFDVGMQPGESNYAFSKFDDALGKTIDINQQAFDDAVDRGLAGVAPFVYLAPIVLGLVCVLAWVGVSPRLREYQA